MTPMLTAPTGPDSGLTRTADDAARTGPGLARSVDDAAASRYVGDAQSAGETSFAGALLVHDLGALRPASREKITMSASTTGAA